MQHIIRIIVVQIICRRCQTSWERDEKLQTSDLSTEVQDLASQLKDTQRLSSYLGLDHHAERSIFTSVWGHVWFEAGFPLCIWVCPSFTESWTISQFLLLWCIITALWCHASPQQGIIMVINGTLMGAWRSGQKTFFRLISSSSGSFCTDFCQTGSSWMSLHCSKLLFTSCSLQTLLLFQLLGAFSAWICHILTK